MKLHTLLLAGALGLASLTEAAPRPLPVRPATLSRAEVLCQAYGVFAFNRAMERNAGAALIATLRLTREWDLQHGTEAEVRRRWHDAIITDIFAPAGQALSPLAWRQFVESHCLTHGWETEPAPWALERAINPQPGASYAPTVEGH